LPVSRELLWLVVVDLRQAWLRPVLAALAIAIAILAVTLFVGQVDLLRSQVLAGYEEGGAATFVAELSDVPDGNVDMLANAIRTLGGVRSVEAPYSGISIGIVADTSFVVFHSKSISAAEQMCSASIGLSILRVITTSTFMT
jgi:hypothetical protein